MRKSAYLHCGKEEFRRGAEEARYWILPGRAEQLLRKKAGQEVTSPGIAKAMTGGDDERAGW